MAIRIISKAKYNAHTQPLFRKLEILPLPKLILYQKLVFFQSVIQKRAPSAFENIWLTNREYRLGQQEANFERELRNDGDFYIPYSRTQTLGRAPIFVLPQEWNQLPPEIQIVRKINDFKIMLKSYLIM